MTYKAIEEANYAAAPVELYEFSINGAFYRYTSSKNTFLATSGEVYSPELIRRSAIKKSANLDRSKLSIEINIGNEIADMFKVNMPELDLYVRVMRTHRDAGETIVIYQGYVTGCEFENNKAILSVEPLNGLLTNNAFTFTYKKICNHNVYDEGCGLDKGLFSRNVTVDGIESNGLSLRINELTEAGGYYTDGLIRIGNTYKHITLHDPVTYTLHIISPFESLSIGDTVTLYKGCSRTIGSCNDFGNFDNFFGFPYIPNKNIFESGL